VSSDDIVQFGGWPQPPKWVWAATGIAVAVLASMVVAHTGAQRTAASSASRSPAAAASPTPAGPLWPSAVGACGSTVDLPRIHLSRQPVSMHASVLIGGTGLREVTPGGAVSGPLPGLPEQNRLVTNVVAGPNAAYVFDSPCTSSTASARIYRIRAGGAHRLGVSADSLIGGPHLAWALSYRSGGVLTQVLSPLAGSRAVRFRSSTDDR
jgi:hypothetical protein